MTRSVTAIKRHRLATKTPRWPHHSSNEGFEGLLETNAEVVFQQFTWAKHTFGDYSWGWFVWNWGKDACLIHWIYNKTNKWNETKTNIRQVDGFSWQKRSAHRLKKTCAFVCITAWMCAWSSYLQKLRAKAKLQSLYFVILSACPAAIILCVLVSS